MKFRQNIFKFRWINLKKCFTTENAESVVEGDDHDLSVGGQDGAVVGVARVPLVRLAVNKDHDWQAIYLVCNKKGGREELKKQVMIGKQLVEFCQVSKFYTLSLYFAIHYICNKSVR